MKPRVVILGAGFAGLTAARALGDECEVTVLANRPWCEFLPNIHEILSRRKRPKDLRIDVVASLSGAQRRFVLDDIAAIDPAGREVIGRTSGAHPYDALIVAVGGVNANHGVQGAAEHALPFKSVDDCSRIRDELESLAESKRPKPRVTIVGAGLEGIEALGEILRAHPTFSIRVVESGERVLGTAPPSVSRVVQDECEAFDVEIRTGVRVVRVAPGGIELSNERFYESSLTIWTGGPTAPPLLYESGLTTKEGAWAPVDETLESRMHPGVFVAGDAAALPTAVEKQAYHAIDMGACAAANVRACLFGGTGTPFSPAPKPTLISFGHLGCFLVAGEWALFGPTVSLAKEAVFQLVTTQLSPPLDQESALASLSRLTGSLPEPTWPSLETVWSDLRGAFDLRLLY